MASKPSCSSTPTPPTPIPPQKPLEESSSCIATHSKSTSLPPSNTIITSSSSSDLICPLLYKRTQRSNPSSSQESFHGLSENCKSRKKESLPSTSKPVPFEFNNDLIAPPLSQLSIPWSTYQSWPSGGVNELLQTLDHLSNFGMERGITSRNQPSAAAAANVEVDPLRKVAKNNEKTEINRVLGRLDISDAFNIFLLAITIFVGFSTAMYHLSDKCAMLNFELAIAVANVLGVASFSVMLLSILGEDAGVTGTAEGVGNEEATEDRIEVPSLQSTKNAKWFHISNNIFFVPILMICITAIMYIVFVYLFFRGTCK